MRNRLRRWPRRARLVTLAASVTVLVASTGIAAAGAAARPKAQWQSPQLDGIVQAQPLVVGDIVVVATQNNSLYGLALRDGHRVWGPRHIGAPVPLSAIAAVNRAANGCGNVDPLGILGTPVADLSAHPPRVYAVAEVLPPGGRVPVHQLVAVESTSGRVVVLPTPIDPPAMNHPELEQQRAALAFSRGIVYAGFGGLYGDCGDYHGFVVGARADGTGIAGVFEGASDSGNGGAAVWAPSGVALDTAGSVYVATGNSLHPPSGNAIDNSDSVVRLDPTSGAVLDVFQPSSWRADNSADLDLGSTAPVLVGDGRLFQLGKQNRAYLLDRASLGGADHHTPLASLPLCTAFGGNATIGTSVYVACNDGVQQVVVDANPPRLRKGWTASVHADGPITIGVGLIWSADHTAGTLNGLDPATGRVVVSHPVAFDSSQHFPAATATAGRVVVEAGRRVVAFTVPTKVTTSAS